MAEPDACARLGDILAGARVEDGAVRAAFPESWVQGHTVFGGLSVATALHAARLLAPELPPLRTAQAQFFAPVHPGEVRVVPGLLRAGTSLVQAVYEVVQAGETRVLISAGFGRALRSTYSKKGTAPPFAGPPKSAPELVLEPWMPRFMGRLEYRLQLGSLPGRDGGPAAIGGWCRLRDPGEVPPEPLLAILGDAWPPPALAARAAPKPASTLTWSMAFPPRPGELDPGAWYAFEGRALSAAEGYVPGRAAVWDLGGRPLLEQFQVDLVFR